MVADGLGIAKGLQQRVGLRNLLGDHAKGVSERENIERRKRN